MATSNDWDDQEMSFETAVISIQEYFKHGEDIAFQIRKSKLKEHLRVVDDPNPDETAHDLLTEEGCSIIPQAVGEFQSPEIEIINNANLYTELEECKYLNIIIPAKEEQIEEDNEIEEDKEEQIEEDNEKPDIKAEEKAFEKFMIDISQQINNGATVPPDYVVVRERKELEKEINGFVAGNKEIYKKLFITLCCHGGESETICTHDTEWPNNDYLKYLGTLADDIPIPIETLMGQCFSYNYDANIVSFNLTVHVSTADEENKKGTVMNITSPFKKDSAGQKVEIDLIGSKASLDTYVSFETAVLRIQEYLKQGEDIAVGIRKSKFEEQLVVDDPIPDPKSITPQEHVEECRYLNIIIPGTKKKREYDAEDKNLYLTEKLDTDSREMAFQNFMIKISQVINKGAEVPHEYVVVRKRKELQQKIKVFVADNNDKYTKLFITLCCHGGESGTILTHTGEWPNDEYLKYLGTLADKTPIPIETLMGQCYSYNYDAKLVSLNLTVHVTTADEENKRGTIMNITAPFKRDSAGEKVEMYLKGPKLRVKVREYIKNAKLDAFSIFSRRLQEQQEQKAENQGIQNKASDQPGDAMVADGEAESMDYTVGN